MVDAANQAVSTGQLDLISESDNQTDTINLIDDEQFKAMKKTFLATGKGRRSSLPSIVVDNKLLVQLFTLREESGCTWNTVDSWLAQACPGNHRPECCRNPIERTVRTYKRLCAEEQASFLSVPVDFNAISPSLSTLGISRVNATSPPSQEIFENDFTCKRLNNKTVIDFRKFHLTENIPLKNLYDWISLFFPKFEMKLILKQISCTMKELRILQGKGTRNPDCVHNFLQEEFVIPIPKPKLPPEPHVCVCKTPVKTPCSNCLSLKEEKKTILDVLRSVQAEHANIKYELTSLGTKYETKILEKKRWNLKRRSLSSKYRRIYSKNVKLMKENNELKMEAAENKKTLLFYRKTFDKQESKNFFGTEGINPMPETATPPCQQEQTDSLPLSL